MPTKRWKNHPQKLLRKTQIHFFFLTALSCPELPWAALSCPELPKQPKQKNSCSKMWFIDQLYIELGQKAWKLFSEYQLLRTWIGIVSWFDWYTKQKFDKTFCTVYKVTLNQDQPSLKVIFFMCQCVKVYPNCKMLLSDI